MNNFPNLKKPTHLFATLFGIGKLPFGPGTWGSVATVFLWVGCSSSIQSNFMILIFILFFSVIICHLATRNLVEKDQKSIVIDEFAGMWLALFIVSDVAAAGLTFLLFRVFDIFKPFPISYIDKNMKSGLGIVLDDLVAGLAAGYLTVLIYSFL
jgi:phosphatidylglycerophosphatase A|tara:strand:- start:1525 stop:1986 length:462 start_codon:yes stop_codon:yes gene_type:complete